MRVFTSFVILNHFIVYFFFFFRFLIFARARESASCKLYRQGVHIYNRRAARVEVIVMVYVGIHVNTSFCRVACDTKGSLKPRDAARARTFIHVR